MRHISAIARFGNEQNRPVAPDREKVMPASLSAVESHSGAGRINLNKRPLPRMAGGGRLASPERIVAARRVASNIP